MLRSLVGPPLYEDGGSCLLVPQCPNQTNGICLRGWVVVSCLVQLVEFRGFISAVLPLSHLVATHSPISPVAASAVAVSMVRDLANVAAASGLILESSAPAFILESRAMLGFSVALSILTVIVRPCFGLIPTTGLPLHVTDAPVVVVTPSVPVVSQHASAVSDVADVIVSVDYANDDVEWLNGSDVLDTVLASALA